MAKKTSTVARRASAEPRFSVLHVDGELNIVEVEAEAIPMKQALAMQERFNARQNHDLVAVVCQAEPLRDVVNNTCWTIDKHGQNYMSFLKQQMNYRMLRIKHALPHITCINDIGAMVRSIEDLVKQVSGDEDGFNSGRDSLDATPEVLENLGYEKT